MTAGSDVLVACSYGQGTAAVAAAGHAHRARVTGLLVAATAHAHGLALYTCNTDAVLGVAELLQVVTV